jgi:hypothetical protein
MSEDLPGVDEGFEDFEDFEDMDAEKLHAVMARASAHIGAVRVDPARMLRARRRRRLSEGGVVAGVLSVALVATGVAMHSGGPHPATYKGPVATGPGPVSQSTTTAAAAGGINPVAVAVYDSDDGSEDNAAVAALLAGTAPWETRQYCQDFATQAGVRKGTGLVFDLGAATRVAGMTATIGVPGADMEMWTADPSMTDMPNVLRGLPPEGFTKQAAVNATTSTAVLTAAHPITTRFVLVWFNDRLPAVPNPSAGIHCAHDDGQRYGDSIAKVVFTRG